jgi:ABC-type amino acid transport substrate-binding protein
MARVKWWKSVLGLLALAATPAVAAETASPRFIAGSINFPPWYIESPSDDGGPGIVVEMTRTLARRSGIDVDIEPQPNARLVQSLAEGTIDFTLGLDQPALRQVAADCGDIGTIEGAVISLATAPITSVRALSGKRIGMIRAYRIEAVLGPDTGAEDVEVEDLPQAARMLAAGRIDGVMGNSVALQHVIASLGGLLAPALKMPPQHAHVWVSPASPLKDRCDALKRAAQAIRAEHALDRVLARY